MESSLGNSYVGLYSSYPMHLSLLEKIYFRHLIKTCLRKIKKLNKLYPFEHFSELRQILLKKDYHCLEDLYFALSEYNHDIYFYSQSLLQIIDTLMAFSLQKRNATFRF